MFRHGMNSGWWCGPGSFFPGPLGMVISILFWGLLIYLLIKIVQSMFFDSQKRIGEKSDNALELLKQRYARGEIDQQEFMKIQRDILE